MGMFFQATESVGKHNATTWEVRSLGQPWRSHLLESREFLIVRSRKTLSIYVLPSSKEHSFFCILNAECQILLERLAWRTFFSINLPWWCECREGSHTHRESKTTIQTSDPSCFLCSRDPGCLGLFTKFLVSVGTYTESELLDWP